MENLMQLVTPVISALLAEAKETKAGSTLDSSDEYKVRLDCNRNPSLSQCDRNQTDYLQRATSLFSSKLRLDVGQVLLCNGIFGAIDMLCRCFCVAGVDNIVTLSPSRHLYTSVASMTGVECRKVVLNADFTMTADDVLALCDEHTKMVFLCSPNDPVGNVLPVEEILVIVELFHGLVVIDESYNAFAKQSSWRIHLQALQNLVIVNSMDISYGATALNVGCVNSNVKIINVLKLLYEPYRLSQYAAKAACRLLENSFEQDRSNRVLAIERQRVMYAVAQLPICKRILKSESNFFLVDFGDNRKVFNYLCSCGILVNDCYETGLPIGRYLRISVGTKSENNLLLSALRGIGDKD